MAMCTVAPRKRKLLELLRDDKVRRIVLFGESGIGKTWTAREISNLARKRGLVGVALWFFLNREYDRDALRDNIIYQLSLLSNTGEPDVDDDNKHVEKDENQGDLQQLISAALAGKMLLLVLDDEGNDTKEPQIVSDLEALLNLTPRNYKYKVLVTTTRNIPSSDGSDNGGNLIELKHLSMEESLSLLKERAGTRVLKDPAIEPFVEHFVERTKKVPGSIILVAKALSYFAQQDSGLQMLKRSLEEASHNEIYDIQQLLRSGYDLVPNSILIDCCWNGKHFFHDRRPIHFNELIAYWMMEGYLGHIDCMKKAYERGHQVLMELIDCHILKKVDADYVIVERPALNLDDVVMETTVINLDDLYRRGFGGTAHLGLANVVGDGPDGKWEGLGRITQKDGAVKTLCNGKQGNKISTLLLDGRAFSRDFSSNFFLSHQELQVLVLFNPTLKTLPPSVMHNLCMLVLRGCHILEKIDGINFGKLTVLEISGPSLLTTIPEDFFEHIPRLQSLNLSLLQIDSLPSSFYKLGELRWLILRECSRIKILKSLKIFKNLIVLDVSGATSLDNIQDKNFKENKELQVLNFSKTKIKSLPLVNSLRKLTHLLLSGCLELDRLRGINAVTSLEVLDLSGANKFKEFHDQSLEKIVNLKIFDLSGTVVDDLPSNIGNPHHLYLKGCPRLNDLSCIETLGHLKTLDLSKAEVKTLPSLSNLVNLRWLLLSCCSKLEKLPDVNSLKNLEVLDLSGCSSLTVLQLNSFEQMSRLWKLDLSGTRINCLPPLSNLSNLRHLILEKCADLRVLPPLESLSNLEELNLCGLSFLRDAGADFLKTMNHLQILNLSETLLQQLPSMSNLKNLHQLYLSGCPGLKTVPGLEALTKLEVLDLSGTAVGHSPFLKNFSNLRRLLLGDYPGPEELPQLGSAPSAGTNVELPLEISEWIHLEQLDLTNMKDSQGAGSNKIEEQNQYGWGIFSLPAEIVGDNNIRLVFLSSSKFIQHLKNNPSLWKTSFKQFCFSVHPTEDRERRGVVSFARDGFIFRDIYFKARQFSDFKEQGSLEIRGFHHPPKGIKDIINHVDSVFFIDNAFESWLSEIGASNLEVLKGCWIERCREMEIVFHEGDVEGITLGGLEVLWVSNSVNLKCIYHGNWHSDTFKNLKRLYLDCCPMLSTVFSSSQLPINLQVLQIKFCDKLEAVFEKASSEPELPKLDTLYLWELPELKSIGCALPSLQTRKVWKCPNLVEYKENVEIC
ncbi:hypothetical protein U1Q18_009049 [Sarracenia purpurea var. burkii]